MKYEQMKTKAKHTMSKANKATLIVLCNVFLILLSIGGGLTGSLAWFASNQEYQVTASSFTVASVGGVEFDLYYLRDFTVNAATKNGNYNAGIAKYAGYERSYVSGCNFQQVLLDANGAAVDAEGDPLPAAENPLSVDQLWPAHKLTYALFIKSGTASTLTLDSFSQVRLATHLEDGTLVSLTWAIDMYGYNYYVPNQATNKATVDYGYTSYRAQTGMTDRFAFDAESEVGASYDTPIDIVDNSPVSAESASMVIYFTIEYSNDPSTWYSYDKAGDFYSADSTLGNSNCYENLQINDLAFTLK